MKTIQRIVVVVAVTAGLGVVAGSPAHADGGVRLTADWSPLHDALGRVEDGGGGCAVHDVVVRTYPVWGSMTWKSDEGRFDATYHGPASVDIDAGCTVYSRISSRVIETPLGSGVTTTPAVGDPKTKEGWGNHQDVVGLLSRTYVDFPALLVQPQPVTTVVVVARGGYKLAAGGWYEECVQRTATVAWMVQADGTYRGEEVHRYVTAC